MIDFKFLEKLLDLLNQSDAHTIEIRKRFWSTSIKISKGGGQMPSGPVTYQVTAPSPAPAPEANPVGAAPPPERVADAAAEVVTDADWIDIKSPMVGTYYAQPEPGSEPYVETGSRIQVGQTLCIIEAMKIMNPLDSEVAGVIRERLVDDAQPVEFGQVLFRVDPNG
jgi:acetyl-CoA carboxylase biotin carboxyl carrier protein